MADDAFDQVKVDRPGKSPASPQVDPGFVGIRIAMPSRLKLGSLERVPLCGTWVLPLSTLEKFPNPSDSCVYLVRDRDTHDSYTGHFRLHVDPVEPEDADQAEPDEDEEEDDDGGTTVMGWFNFNLGRAWKIPERPARYSLVIVLGEIQSNQVTFEVVEDRQ
jgi:hypothetical protein